MSFLLLCACILPVVAQQARLDTNRSTDLIVLLSLSLILNAPLGCGILPALLSSVGVLRVW